MIIIIIIIILIIIINIIIEVLGPGGESYLRHCLGEIQILT